MSKITSIGRLVFAALALAVVAVGCDDATPTKVADEAREAPKAIINPWTTIFATAETLGGPAKIAFAGNDRSYRLGPLDPGWPLPQDGPEAADAVCTVADATNRLELDVFRQCMARALREDVCQNGGVFVLYRPDTGAHGTWRVACPASVGEDDDPEDDQSRVSDGGI